MLPNKAATQWQAGEQQAPAPQPAASLVRLWLLACWRSPKAVLLYCPCTGEGGTILFSPQHSTMVLPSFVVAAPTAKPPHSTHMAAAPRVLPTLVVPTPSTPTWPRNVSSPAIMTSQSSETVACNVSPATAICAVFVNIHFHYRVSILLVERYTFHIKMSIV